MSRKYSQSTARWAQLPPDVKRYRAEWAKLSPRAFEEYVADLFRANGYRAQVAGRHGSGDGGVDLILYKGGKKSVAQCKRLTGRSYVGVGSVREFCSVVQHIKSAQGFYVTSGFFSKDAQGWAKEEPIELIDAHRLTKWASKVKPRVESVANKPAQSESTPMQVTSPFLYQAESASSSKEPRFFFTTTQWVILGVMAFILVVLFFLISLVVVSA